MSRVNLTDGSGGWFDESKAKEFSEHTNWDGSNHISVNTGSQWEHESLYYTRSGSWIHCYWSQWQGSGGPTYSTVDSDAAMQWLQRNEYNIDDLPENIRDSFSSHLSSQEV